MSQSSMPKPHLIVIRPKWFPYLSTRIHQNAPLVVMILLLITFGAAVLSISTGEYPIPVMDVVRALFRLPTSDPNYDLVVNSFRAPRIAAAFIVGIMLALSGSIMQAITRNPLASPELTGVSSGATLVAVLTLVILPDFPLQWLPFSAFAGGMAVALFIYVMAWRGQDSPLRLILIGIGLMATTGALTNIMITFGEILRVQAALTWLAGSVYGRTWADVQSVLPWLLFLLPPALLMTRELNALALGDEVATSLGSPVGRNRFFLLLVSAALAGTSVVLAGTLSFVGLVAPHLGRRLVGPAHEGLQLVSALIGGTLVVVADLIGRLVFAPAEVPCGLIVSMLGAPFFLWLLYKHQKR